MVLETSGVSFADVVGLHEAKNTVREVFELPQHFEELTHMKWYPKWSGLLLYGPPGTGKTQFAKACATELKCAFINVMISDIMSKWQGDSERKVKAVFSYARAFRDKCGCIVFIDEIDVLCSERGGEGESEQMRRIKTQLLTELDGVTGNAASAGVLVVGATNHFAELDKAMLRRFPKQVFVGLPDQTAREQLLRKFTDLESPEEVAELARAAEGCSGAELHTVVMQAGSAHLQEFLATEWLVPLDSESGSGAHKQHKWRPACDADFTDRFCVACDARAQDAEEAEVEEQDPEPCVDCGWVRARVMQMPPNTVRLPHPEFRHYLAAVVSERCRARTNTPQTAPSAQPASANGERA